MNTEIRIKVYAKNPTIQAEVKRRDWYRPVVESTAAAEHQVDLISQWAGISRSEVKVVYGA